MNKKRAPLRCAQSRLARASQEHKRTVLSADAKSTEYCGKQEHHEYQLYLGIENIDHSKTKARSPQSNGISERFHKAVLDEFYRVASRRRIYNNLDERG